MDETLRRARRATWRVWQEDVAVRPQGDWADLGGLVCHTTGIDHRPWNAAFLTSADGLDRLDEARAWFGSRGMPWGLLVPEELPVEPPGMEPVTHMRLMTRQLTDLPPTPEVDLLWGEPEPAAQVQDAAFTDAPGTNLRLLAPKVLTSSAAIVTACSGGRPVSTATVVVADGVAAVFGVATLPDVQRQGYGGAVTLAVLHRAMGLGCDLAILNPTDAGHALYGRLGFSDAKPWRIWADPEVSPRDR